MGGVFFFGVKDAAADCQVNVMNVRPNGVQPPIMGTAPSINDFPPDGYDDDNRPYVYVDLQTSGCENSTLRLVVMAAQQMGGAADDNVDQSTVESILVAMNLPLYIGPAHPQQGSGNHTDDNNFTVSLYAGDKGCHGEALNGSSYDCGYAFGVFYTTTGELLKQRGRSYYWPDPNFAGQVTWSNLFVSPQAQHQPEPALMYDCDGCFLYFNYLNPGDSWQFEGILDYQESDAGGINVDNIPGTTTTSYFTPGYDQYLAPLPGFLPGQTATLGGFLKSFFQLLIVVAGILALLMIVIGAVTYASADAITGKSQGKEMILNAILGLIMALGAWIILNTINPKLASELSITIPTVSINPKFEPENSVGDGVTQITLNTSGGGTVTMTACDETQLSSVVAFGGKTITIHQGLVNSITAINAAWEAMPAANRYAVNSIAGFNCRKVSGTNSWSSHAFGTAVDINPDKNPFGPNLVTDMPTSFVNLWTSQGWGWGGGWDSVKDAMHFSKYPTSEDGDGIISN